jgi:hypothetical protein
MTGWMGPRAGLDASLKKEKENLFPPTGNNAMIL